MTNKISSVLFMLVMIISVTPCYAGDGWQANLSVSSGQASSRLTFGQNPAATDGKDGFYDVPVLFSGSLRAAFIDGGGELWRDIRSADGRSKDWRLEISSDSGEQIRLSWDKAALSGSGGAELVDPAVGNSIDMKVISSYTIRDGNSSELLIQIRDRLDAE